MDDSQIDPAKGRDQTVIERLMAQAGLLLGIAVIFIALVAFGELQIEYGIISYLFVIAFVLLLPLRYSEDEVTAESRPSALSQSGTVAQIGPFVEALGEVCFVLDGRGMVVFLNEAARRNYPNVQVGKGLTLVLRNPELTASIEAVLRLGVARSFELHEILPSETWDRVTVAPLRLPDAEWGPGAGQFLLVSFQSLTELKRVDAMRSDFIANASHELRTPLASLLGFIDTLLGPAAKDAAAREKFLGIMRGQADRMSRLIDDLLSLSRIEMHQHVLPTGSVDLAGLLREVAEGLQTQAQAADIVVNLDVPEGAVTVKGDRNQLYEVFENLVDNAIKYGAGGKTVEVVLQPVERSGFHYLVSVIDHGPGVEPEHVPRMTERFYRIDAETSRKKKGTGLGLAIVKHIVQRHRGQISIRSKPGEGLRVDVMLP